jgi:hypothetical protein
MGRGKVNGRSPIPFPSREPIPILRPANESDSASLTEACQRNGWLKDDGYAWQDDPAFGERPFTFLQTPDMEGLGAYLRQGPRPLRQGIVYKDLALVQQADCGDDWWALRRDGCGWKEIDSVPAAEMASNDPEGLKAFVESALEARPVDLSDRERFHPERVVGILCGVSLEYAAYEVMDEYDDYGEFRESAGRALKERPDLACEFLDGIAEEMGDITASSLAIDIRRMTGGRPALSSRAASARTASERLADEGPRERSRIPKAR